MTPSLQNSTIILPLSLSKLTIEALINKELANIKWKDNLEVTKVTIHGEGPVLKLYLDVKSLYDAQVEVSFVPLFEKKEQRMLLQNLKVALNENGILAKGINWLMKGFAEEKLIHSIQTQLDEKISLLTSKFINQAINLPVAALLNLNLTCQEMDLKNIRYEKDVLLIDVTLNGQIRLDSIDS